MVQGLGLGGYMGSAKEERSVPSEQKPAVKSTGYAKSCRNLSSAPHPFSNPDNRGWQRELGRHEQKGQTAAQILSKLPLITSLLISPQHTSTPIHPAAWRWYPGATFKPVSASSVFCFLHPDLPAHCGLESLAKRRL